MRVRSCALFIVTMVFFMLVAQNYETVRLGDAPKVIEVDTTQIILFGFSTGRYGVYRTFYETPSKYKAIAIFSGGPSVGKRDAPDMNPPHFGGLQYLKSFQDLPIFISHGEKDMNVPIMATRDLMSKLQNVGVPWRLALCRTRGMNRPAKRG